MVFASTFISFCGFSVSRKSRLMHMHMKVCSIIIPRTGLPSQFLVATLRNVPHVSCHHGRDYCNVIHTQSLSLGQVKLHPKSEFMKKTSSALTSGCASSLYHHRFSALLLIMCRGNMSMRRLRMTREKYDHEFHTNKNSLITRRFSSSLPSQHMHKVSQSLTCTHSGQVFKSSGRKYSNDTSQSLCDKNDEEEYNQYWREVCTIPGMGHRVLVIQPDIKAGSKRYAMTTRELKLEETCALVRTLPKWKVIEKQIVRTDHERTKQVFGSGNFQKLVQSVRSNKAISAVVLGIDRLSGLQINTLQASWKLPVYDRYTIVLQIFKDHAQSKEAKLQVALAEIPYIKSRLHLIHGGYDPGVAHLVGGSSPMFLDRRRMLLQRRETKLKKQLNELYSKRQHVREDRVKNSVPTVAIVGYTNSGKTTLIKALTDDESLIPQNQLFATLDVTSHEGQLASKLKVTYIDTVGFISDMPASLLNAFRATLEDAMTADVVLHVRDASHPDRKLQIVSVHNSLHKMLTESQLENMIEVYNKTDICTEEDTENLDPSILKISAVTGAGLPELGSLIETRLLATSGQMEKTFRIPNGGPIFQWLQEETAVKSAIPDPRDSQFLIVHVIISKPAYGKFQARFARKKK